MFGRTIATACATIALSWSSHAHAKPAPSKKDAAEMLKLLEAQTIRGVNFDLCYPTSAEEYEALGKNAVIMLTASSVLASELPLRSAYVMSKGVRIPLQRLAIFDKHLAPSASDPSKVYTEQVSFYLLPLYLVKKDAHLLVDFSGQRTGFGVTTFSAKTGAEAPAFVRLDEFDNTTDADLTAVSALLRREYPEYFKPASE